MPIPATMATIPIDIRTVDRHGSRVATSAMAVTAAIVTRRTVAQLNEPSRTIIPIAHPPTTIAIAVASGRWRVDG